MIVAPHGTVEKTPCGLFSPLTSIHTDLSLLTPAIKVRRQDSERILREKGLRCQLQPVAQERGGFHTR